ncbi:hypothetical protein [Saccharomonospora iraqiensis]|uniref:hypothetical protein n=1 Tax=Saccharomonospora iraqiensis TaxID=52698 RepID=UPI00022E31E6|nr:hypothetical protein [Saccharomonospora iraqiensis]
MTFEETLPAIVVLGYALVVGLGLLGSRVRPRTVPVETGDQPAAETGDEPETPATVAPAPDDRDPGRRRLAATCTTLAWVLGVAVTITWLYAAVGIEGIITIVLVLVVIPFVVTFGGMLIGAARKRRSGGPVDPIWPQLLLGGGGLVFLVIAVNLVVNSAAYFFDYGERVALRITSSFSGNSSRNTVSGTYELGGSEHYADQIWWLGGAVPEPGTVVNLAIGPWWPYPFLTSTLDAALWMVIAAVLTVPGALLAVAAFRARSDSSRETTASANT